MKIIFFERKYHNHFSLPWAISPTGLDSADHSEPSLSRTWPCCLKCSSQKWQAIPHLEPWNIPVPGSSFSNLLTQKAPFNSQPQCWTDRLSLTAPFQVHNISCLFCITALCSPPSQPFPDFVRCSCMLVYQKITSSHPQQDPRPPRGVTWVPLTLEAQHPAEWPRSQNLWNNWADEKMDEWQRTFSNRFIPQLKKKKVDWEVWIRFGELQ